MKLSDTEKRELIRLIENGKSIPDEYRFKIFETTLLSITPIYYHNL